ncbi:MAG: hypothetical protein OIF54_15370, partial [Cohaesibacter sp.]|nr:hypothetical protein [Cohaesibacter sp.]
PGQCPNRSSFLQGLLLLQDFIFVFFFFVMTCSLNLVESHSQYIGNRVKQINNPDATKAPFAKGAFDIGWVFRTKGQCPVIGLF